MYTLKSTHPSGSLAHLGYTSTPQGDRQQNALQQKFCSYPFKLPRFQRSNLTISDIFNYRSNLNRGTEAISDGNKINASSCIKRRQNLPILLLREDH